MKIIGAFVLVFSFWGFLFSAYADETKKLSCSKLVTRIQTELGNVIVETGDELNSWRYRWDNQEETEAYADENILVDFRSQDDAIVLLNLQRDGENSFEKLHLGEIALKHLIESKKAPGYQIRINDPVIVHQLNDEFNLVSSVLEKGLDGIRQPQDFDGYTERRADPFVYHFDPHEDSLLPYTTKQSGQLLLKQMAKLHYREKLRHVFAEKTELGQMLVNIQGWDFQMGIELVEIPIAEREIPNAVHLRIRYFVTLFPREN